jgi:hypothetical protein
MDISFASTDMIILWNATASVKKKTKETSRNAFVSPGPLHHEASKFEGGLLTRSVSACGASACAARGGTSCW